MQEGRQGVDHHGQVEGAPVSLALIEVLLGRASVLVADRWDGAADHVLAARGAAAVLSAAFPPPAGVSVAGLGSMSLQECLADAAVLVRKIVWDRSDTPDAVLVADLSWRLAVLGGIFAADGWTLA